MLIHRLASALLIVLSVLTAGWCHAGDWPQRPRLEDYREYSRFLEAMQAYRNALKDVRISPPLSLGVELPVSTTLRELGASSAEMLDPLSEDYPAPLQITGPEDMEQAIEKAKSFIHPVYTARLRYKRTTSFSFPLPRAGNDTLATAAATDVLWGVSAAEGGTMLSQLLYADELLSAEHAGTNAGHWGELPVSAVPEGFSGPPLSGVMMFGQNTDVMIQATRR